MDKTDLVSILSSAVEKVCDSAAAYADEQTFQRALATQLGKCEQELRMSFDPAVRPRRQPPVSAIAECKRKGKILPPTGMDPCSGSRRKLDLLWHSSAGEIPVELKARDRWTADTYGYEFLKDLHRLERLTKVNGSRELSDQRFAVFVTNVSDYWTSNGSREPRPLRVTDGRSIEAGYWVQYDQPSAVTQWYGYPPFFLSNQYTFRWRGLPTGAGMFLLVPVSKQESLRA